MPIMYSDPTYAALTVETAANVGARKAAEREVERKQQMDIAAMEIQARRELAEFEVNMRLQSQKLSQAWELEKMQRESELDFQNEQNKITVARSAALQKQTMAKQQYLSYTDNIDSDNSLSADEKAAFKRMAYDKMVAGIEVAERIYFPETYQKDSILSQFDTAGGDTQTAPSGTTENTNMAYIQQARLSLPESASPQEVAEKADELKTLETYEAEISQQAQGQMSAAEVKKAAQDRLTEDKVRSGYESSKNLRTPEAPFQAWKKFTEAVSPLASAIRPAQKLNMPEVIKGTPEYAQLQADKARAKLRAELAEDEEVAKYPRTSSIPKHLRVLMRRIKRNASKQPTKLQTELSNVYKQQGGYNSRSDIMRRGLPSLYE